MIKTLFLGAVGALFLLGVPGAMAVECTGEISDMTVDKVFVPAGAECILANVTVENGDIQVGQDATLDMSYVTVTNGNIQANNAYYLSVYWSSLLNGGVHADGAQFVAMYFNTITNGNVKLENGLHVHVNSMFVVAPYLAEGNIQVRGFSELAWVGANVVLAGNIKVERNRVAWVNSNNVINGNIKCFDNENLLVSGNTAGGKIQCGD